MESCDNCSEDCKYSKECLGEGIPFQRLRRITGYLVGDVSRWNDGKKAELEDRVKHDEDTELVKSDKL